jgi:archaellum component FlaC
MTTESENIEKYNSEKINRLEQHYSNIKKDVADINQKLNLVLSSLIGDDKMGSIGVVDRLKELESELEDLKKAKIQTDVYMRIIIFIGSLITAGIITLIVKNLI